MNNSTAATAAATEFGFVSVKGNQLIDSPPNKFTLNANYTFHFAPGNLTFSATDSWTDYHWSAIFNSPLYYSPGYNNLDLRLIWTDVQNRFTIIAYGRNVLNAVQYDYIYPGHQRRCPCRSAHSLNAPVTYGVCSVAGASGSRPAPATRFLFPGRGVGLAGGASPAPLGRR